ncbi:MAG TPA: hypothetical protein VHM31_02540 [Polyangia bacterium]|nr:hypothetical protein [Polyangia bacterium]
MTAALVLTVVLAQNAIGQVDWRARAAATLDARGLIGTGDVRGIDLGAAGVGIEWWAAPTLRLRTTALLLGAHGQTDAGRTAHGGAGGELAMRLVPFPGWPVRPYARVSAGFLLFLRGPFLPGAGYDDFILGAGSGLEVPVGPRVVVFGEVALTHLSNGKGIGTFNPAYNGWGGLVGLSATMQPAPDRDGQQPAPEPDTPAATHIPGVIADAQLGWTNQLGAGGGARVSERLVEHWIAIGELRALALGDTPYEAAGLALASQWRHATVGAQITYQHLPGISAVAEQVQVEAHLTPEASLFATAITQQQTVFADFLVAGFGVRAFPFDRLRFDGGLGLTRPFGALASTTLGPYVSVEWQLPLPSTPWQLSLFAERQLSTNALAGVRLAWNMGATLRDVARRTGWLRIQ